MFMHICLHLDDVIIAWQANNRADFMAQHFLDSRLQYESLEGLMDFLVFQVLRLWQNNWKLIREMPTNPLLIKCSYRSNAEKLYAQLKILNLNGIYKLHIAKLMHQFKHGCLPSVFDNLFTKSDNIHSYNIRQKNLRIYDWTKISCLYIYMCVSLSFGNL